MHILLQGFLFLFSITQYTLYIHVPVQVLINAVPVPEGRILLEVDTNEWNVNCFCTFSTLTESGSTVLPAISVLWSLQISAAVDSHSYTNYSGFDGEAELS